MRALNIDWTGQIAKASKAGARAGTRTRRSTSSAVDSYQQRPLKLTGNVGYILWGVFIVVVYVATQNFYIAGFILFAVSRRFAITHAQEARDAPKTYTPLPRYVSPSVATAPVVAPVAPEVPLEAFEVVRMSVWQDEAGPTVSVITVPDGEIFTKSFPSWQSAGRYVAKVKGEYEAQGVAVEFITEKV